MLVIAIAWSFWLGLHRSRHPGDARLFVAAAAATMIATLVCGKVLSPQFIVWLLPVGFVIAGRFGPATAVATAAAMLLTFSYFPHRYWDLVAMQDGPIALLVLRDTALIALLCCAWPRPSIAGRPLGRVLGRERTDPPRAEQAVRGPLPHRLRPTAARAAGRPESSGARVPAPAHELPGPVRVGRCDPARVGQQALRGTGQPAPDGGLGPAVGENGPHHLGGLGVTAVVAQHEGGLVARLDHRAHVVPRRRERRRALLAEACEADRRDRAHRQGGGRDGDPTAQARCRRCGRWPRDAEHPVRSERRREGVIVRGRAPRATEDGHHGMDRPVRPGA